jgi:hypothetical protein
VVEREAKALLASREALLGGFGPWLDPAEDFEVIGALCATLRGLEAGRITWVEQVSMETVTAPEIDPPP